jgi:hypothetical protein
MIGNPIPGQPWHDFSVALSASPTRYAGAIRTWRSTPTLQYSITPRGRFEDSLPDVASRLVRHSLPEF